MPLRNDRKRREAETALRAHWEARQAAQEAGLAADMRTFPDIHDESLSSLGDFSSRLMSRLHLAEVATCTYACSTTARETTWLRSRLLPCLGRGNR